MSQITSSLLRILAIAGLVYSVLSRRYGIVVVGLISLALGILYRYALETLGATTLSDAVGKLNAIVAADGGYGAVLSRLITDMPARIKPYLIGDDNTFKPRFSVARTWQLWTARFLLTSFGLFAFLQLGASRWFSVPWFISFVLLLSVFHRFIITSQKEDYAGTRYWLLAAWIGALVTWAFLFWLAASLTQRINWNGPYRAIGLIAVMSLASLSGFSISTTSSSLRDRSVPWVNLFVGLTVFPFCIAWALASLSAAYVKPLFNGLPGNAPTEEARQKELSLRSAWSQQPGWQKQGKTPLTIAVALSGGGYRAALIHAGVLQALDERCVPIRYLSTVSGGSIVGTYYALGYTPHQFKDRMKRQKPGLPDQFLSIWTQARSWFGSSTTNAETYADFFSRAFFGASVLADTGIAPQLLVNATDIERTANAREVFFKGRSHAFPELDNTRLADVVAASAAFPGVFQPKKIVWTPPDGDQVLADRRFVDGGVVENLGYTGLERFFNIAERPELSPKPDYLIISDASAEGSSGALPNTDSWELLSRSQDIAYAFQVGLVHNLLDGEGSSDFLHKPLFVRAQEQDIRDALKNEWFSSSAATVRISGTQIADEVTRYSTLAELDEDQVEKAFWLGHALGEIRWRQIEQWREAFTTEPSCRSGQALASELR